MGNSNTVFERYEEKYILGKDAHRSLQGFFLQKEKEGLLCPDAFGGHSHIANIYFDTPDRRLIRRSLEKPVYKEKLRLRSYREVDRQGEVFIEMKKKYKGIVYKRRISLPLEEAERFLYEGDYPENPDQVEAEILWLLQHYPGMAPAMYIGYERRALRGTEQADLRITFDTDIRWRAQDLRLGSGRQGQPLLSPGEAILEIKTTGALPLWLSHMLCAEKIYPTSFSKYGNAHIASLHPHLPSAQKTNILREGASS